LNRLIKQYSKFYERELSNFNAAIGNLNATSLNVVDKDLEDKEG
jgi:hypothetical protein